MKNNKMDPAVLYEIEKDFDAFTEIVREKLEKEKDEQKMVNLLQYDKMKFVESVMKKLAFICDAKVKTEINKTFQSVGSVTVEGKDLFFTNLEWFARASEFANNIEIYPLEKNLVRITFTFHGLVRSV